MKYLRQMLAHDITFGIGPAGTGKTFLAVACAVDALERQGVQRIVLTRPAVEAGERLGFLPGDLAQKVDPYLRPLYDALYDLMGFDRVGRAFEKGLIEIAPLAFMRGRTLNHAFVILDEAQNTTREQMKMFLTRIGFGSKCVVTGDTSQVDLPKGTASGLVDAERCWGRGGHRLHAFHRRRRGAPPAGGPHRRGLRRSPAAGRRGGAARARA
jgi:phosphate starvation-inducible PhoH-like protein